MATEARVRQATSAARKLQTLHKGEAAYLVLANSDGIDCMETDATQQNIEYLARWSILGVIATSGADVVWMELLPDHDYPPLTEQEIATAMEWTRDRDPAHYTPEYCAAKILAFCGSRRFDATGPILMGERLIFDPSVPSETDGLLLEIASVLDTTRKRSNSRLTRENFFSTMMARFSSSGRVSELRTKSARLNLWSPQNRTRTVVSRRPWRTSCFTENWPAKSSPFKEAWVKK